MYVRTCFALTLFMVVSNNELFPNYVQCVSCAYVCTYIYIIMVATVCVHNNTTATYMLYIRT